MDSHRSISLDNLRGIAVLLVVLYHFKILLGLNSSYNFNNWGNLGVDIFFILSGFLIFNSYEKSFSKYGLKQGITIYAINRFFRIVPAYYFNLFVILLIAPFFIADHTFLFSGQFLKQIIRHLFFLAYIVDKDNGWGLNGSLWTLSIEMLWYLSVPILFLFFNSRRKFYFLMALSILYIISLDVGWLDYYIDLLKPDAIFNVPTEMVRWWFYHQLPGQFILFGIGIIFYRLHAEHAFGYLEKHLYQRLKLNNRLLQCICFMLALFLIISATAFQSNIFILRTFVMSLISASIFILIFIAKQSNPGVLSWIGKISYSIYLWHYPLLAISKKINVLQNISLFLYGIIYLVFLLIIFSMSYYFIEEQGFILRRKWRDRLLTPLKRIAS